MRHGLNWRTCIGLIAAGTTGQRKDGKSRQVHGDAAPRWGQFLSGLVNDHDFASRLFGWFSEADAEADGDVFPIAGGA